MKICIVGPGILPIPPSGWGAVEILIDDYRKNLEALGHEVEEAGPDLDGDLVENTFDTVFAAGMAASIDGIAHRQKRQFHEGDFEPLTWYMYERGCRVSAGAYLQALVEQLAV